MFTFFLISFLAGVLTVLAPCVLPMLPIIVGGTLAKGGGTRRAYTVITSLAISLFLFTLILKVSTAFITIPEVFWTYLSGGIILLIGLSFLISGAWADAIGQTGFGQWANRLMGKGFQKNNIWGDVIMGAALGPVFATCSPTYFIIIATVLPASLTKGIIYLLAYIAGVVAILLVVTVLGDKILARLNVLADPHGKFKRVIGIVFIIVGVAIIFRIDKAIEADIAGSKNFWDVTQVEHKLLESAGTSSSAVGAAPVSKNGYIQAPEITKPSGFVNTNNQPITIGQFRGKKVVLVDFWTYSCINCQRTLPYMVALNQKYAPYGLQIISIHTPEFAFEKNIDNVRKAAAGFGITYPIVLDNDYGTWGAFANEYWPRKYLIDLDGNIVYDHIGEGGYAETEAMVVTQLKRAGLYHGEKMPDIPMPAESTVFAETPEIYFGSSRNEYLGNMQPFAQGQQNGGSADAPLGDGTATDAPLTSGSTGGIQPNHIYLQGIWSFNPEYATPLSKAKVTLTFSAQKINMVAGSEKPVDVNVYIDGKFFQNVTISDQKLYTLADGLAKTAHTVELRIPNEPSLQLFTFTFG